MAVCHGARQPSVLELQRRAQFAGFANGERADRHGRSPRAATCGLAGLKSITMSFSVRSRSRWTSHWLNWPRCSAQSMEPYLHRAPSGASSTVTRSEEHTSELQSLMRISYAVFCLKKKKEKIKLI